MRDHRFSAHAPRFRSKIIPHTQTGEGPLRLSVRSQGKVPMQKKFQRGPCENMRVLLLPEAVGPEVSGWPRNLTGLNLLAPQHTCEAACLQYPLRAKAEGVAQDVRLAIASHRDVPSSSLCGSTLATATSTAAIICTIATITIIAHISHLHAPSESEPHDGSGSFT